MRLAFLLSSMLVACGDPPQVEDESLSARGESVKQVVAPRSAPSPADRLVPEAGNVVAILADLRVRMNPYRVSNDWYDDESYCFYGDRVDKRVERDDHALRVFVRAKTPTGIELEFELRPTDIGPPMVAVVASAYSDLHGLPGNGKADITWGVVYVTTSNVLRTPVIEMKFHLLIDKGGKRTPVSGGLVVK